MRITVIIPVYNNSRYIRSCIESIKTQRLDDVELIAVNDGSTDDSGLILKEYVEKGTLRLIEIEHSGQATARNRALEIATGDKILFVDADDVLIEGSVKRMLEVSQLTGADIVAGEILRCNPKACRRPTYTGKIKELDRHTAIEEVLYKKHYGYLGSVCGKLFSHRLFEENRFCEGLFYEDVEIMPRLLHTSSKTVYLNEVVYLYRKNPDSFINTWNDRRLDIFKALECIGRQQFIDKDSGCLTALSDRELSAAFNIMFVAHSKKQLTPRLREQCESIVRKYRKTTIFNSRSRKKNRLASAISYVSFDLLRYINKLFGVTK